MTRPEHPQVPIWAASKAKKRTDILKEAAKALEESERVRARQSIETMTERDLESEQLRLADLLQEGTITVDGFRRLREIDFYLEAMGERRHDGSTYEGWQSERLGDQ